MVWAAWEVANAGLAHRTLSLIYHRHTAPRAVMGQESSSVLATRRASAHTSEYVMGTGGLKFGWNEAQTVL